MTKRHLITKKSFMKALAGSGGILSVVAKRLKVHRNTLTNFLKKNPEVYTHVDEAKEELIDMTESKLVECVQDKDVPAIKFVLSCLGKNRGWGEKQDIILNNINNTLNVVMSDDEVKELTQIHEDKLE